MSEQEKSEETVVQINRKPVPSKHVVRLINGQPVCISCEYRHTLKIPREELEIKGEIVVDSN